MKNRILNVILLLFCLLVIFPSVYIVRYSYPVQDDFSYAMKARELMQGGYGVWGLAWHMVISWYRTWGGLYSSTFWGFVFSAIAMCDPFKISLIEGVIAVFFYFSVGIWIYALSHHVFGLKKYDAISIYSFLVFFISGVAYYGDFEAFYWFIASVQYLLLISFTVLGAGLYIIAFNSEGKKKYFLIVATSICGFMGAGANLSIVALLVMLYFFETVYGLYYATPKNRTVACSVIFPFIGAIVNVVAPGNYVRAGEAIGLYDLVIAARDSVRYTFERIWIYLSLPEFWMIVVLFISITLFLKRNEMKREDGFKHPIVVSVAMLLAVCIVVFPVTLGYGYEVLGVLMRGQYVFDFAIFSSIIVSVLYIEQWLHSKISIDWHKCRKQIIIVTILLMVPLCFLERNDRWRWIGVIRQYRDLSAGRFENYKEYYLDILEQVANSPYDIPIIWIDEEIAEKTCQVNPIIWYDYCYDPQEDYVNGAIATFYGKKSFWILHPDYVPTESDIIIGKKYDSEEQFFNR